MVKKEFASSQTLIAFDDQLNLLAQDFTRHDLCTDQPELVNQIIIKGKQLGVEIIQGLPKLPGKDATYEAFYHKLGRITISNRPMHPIVYCQLMVHEFIHVLQHLKSDLKAVHPLGWYIKPLALEKHGKLIIIKQFDFQGALDNAKTDGKNTSWRSIRDCDLENNQDYQIIDKTSVLEFRKKVSEKLLSFIKDNMPSLAETDKSLPPNDWIH